MLRRPPTGSEQARGVVGRRDAEVSRPALGDDAAAGGALDEALLEQVGLVDVLDRVLLLVDRGRKRREAHRPARELHRDGVEDGAVVTVEAGLSTSSRPSASVAIS